MTRSVCRSVGRSVGQSVIVFQIRAGRFYSMLLSEHSFSYLSCKACDQALCTTSALPNNPFFCLNKQLNFELQTNKQCEYSQTTYVAKKENFKRSSLSSGIFSTIQIRVLRIKNMQKISAFLREYSPKLNLNSYKQFWKGMECGRELGKKSCIEMFPHLKQLTSCLLQTIFLAGMNQNSV